MCHSKEFQAFEVRKEVKTPETSSAHERRAEVIGALLGDASKQPQEAKPERAPAKQAEPAE